MEVVKTKFSNSQIAVRLLSILAILAIMGFCLTISYQYSHQYFLKSQATEDAETSRLVVSGLSDYLERYDSVPALLARDSTVLEFFSVKTKNDRPLEKMNILLKNVTVETGASDIYLIDLSGTTVASSNYDKAHSFIGRNLSYRPYVKKSIKGEKAIYFALGTTSLRRGYYFSAPVKINDQVVGVVAVKIEIDEIEDGWQKSGNEIVAVDGHGIIFMSSHKNWLFKSMNSLPLGVINAASVIENIKRSRQYPLSKLGILDTQFVNASIKDVGLLTILDSEDRSHNETFLATPANVINAGWTVYVLSPITKVAKLSYSVMFVTFLLLLLLFTFVGFIIHRRAQFINNVRQQEQAKRELENRVEERTRDLKVANNTLSIEVNERIQTEEKLRATQRELVQAGKLAALGQMSAALSHELNQPLAAIRTYADNAGEFLKRNNTTQAKENIDYISMMSDRMAELTRHLRNFARKPNQTASCVDLEKVFKAVEVIMSGRIKDSRAKINFNFERRPIYILGGEGRLQQVFVNLLSNSLDAMKDKDQPAIDISIEYRDQKSVVVYFRDYGTGLSDEIKDRVFDPFFTTKGVNEGLGLGLSISYNVLQDFNGELKSENHVDGGAIFSVTLQLANTKEIAAE
ncbi:sensor histidine kinase [Lentilitoribacter sp. EG35]|uniref:sensor histidine kinase n=1 Tax=Lentilitoribacter sp. EG35 TaxID=3234192 RepID=UPI0034601A33